MPDQNLKTKLVTYIDAPKEILLDYPTASLMGNDSLTIQNHKGLIEYTDTVIRLKTALGPLRIEGCDFLIKQLNQESLQLTGVIHGLRYEMA